MNTPEDIEHYENGFRSAVNHADPNTANMARTGAACIDHYKARAESAERERDELRERIATAVVAATHAAQDTAGGNLHKHSRVVGAMYAVLKKRLGISDAEDQAATDRYSNELDEWEAMATKARAEAQALRAALMEEKRRRATLLENFSHMVVRVSPFPRLTDEHKQTIERLRAEADTLERSESVTMRMNPLDELDEDAFQCTFGRLTYDIGYHGGWFVCRRVVDSDWENPAEEMRTDLVAVALSWLQQQLRGDWAAESHHGTPLANRLERGEATTETSSKSKVNPSGAAEGET